MGDARQRPLSSRAMGAVAQAASPSQWSGPVKTLATVIAIVSGSMAMGLTNRCSDYQTKDAAAATHGELQRGIDRNERRVEAAEVERKALLERVQANQLRIQESQTEILRRLPDRRRR